MDTDTLWHQYSWLKCVYKSVWENILIHLKWSVLNLDCYLLYFFLLDGPRQGYPEGRCPAEFSFNHNQMQLNQLINIFRSARKSQASVLEPHSAEQYNFILHRQNNVIQSRNDISVDQIIDRMLTTISTFYLAVQVYVKITC